MVLGPEHVVLGRDLSESEALIANCETIHETGGLLELNGWKHLDSFENGDDTLDVWCAPKNWRDGGGGVEVERMGKIAVHGMLLMSHHNEYTLHSQHARTEDNILCLAFSFFILFRQEGT